jgi:hypothetical protein
MCGEEALDIIAVDRRSAVETGQAAERALAGDLADVQRQVPAYAPDAVDQLACDRTNPAPADNG